MKKFLLMIAAVAMMVSCTGNANQGSGSASAAGGDEGYQFSVQNGISGTTGTKNCFLPELGAPISFEVAGEGDILDVTAKVTIKHKDKTEVEEMTEPAELWISGRDDDNGDVKLVLKIEEESQTKLVEWLNKPAGEEVELVFKARLPKADMDKLNAKECTNTLVL
ncbi:MAG: hypothetical protein IJM66_02410 [Muribaculaceae bacterium]|nr:hypothetical protein [Muribaculaceae bacterium]